MGCWALEEDLTAQLVFLFRSPDALIKYTRHPNPDASDVDCDTDENNIAPSAHKRNLTSMIHKEISNNDRDIRDHVQDDNMDNDRNYYSNNNYEKNDIMNKKVQ